MKITILGCYAATPRSFTNPTSQVLEIKNHLFLIDCGEGTQVQLRRNKIKFSKIKHIFISHLHGDHFYGLVGLVSTFRLLNRESELHIYGPKGIKEIITLQLKLANSWTNFPLIFHELTSKEPELLFEDTQVSVSTLPLKHRVYTNGFLFKEKEGDRRLLMDKAEEYNIDYTLFKSLKKGKDVVSEDGKLIPNRLVTEDPSPPKSYAFCSDTVFDMDLVPMIKNTTALYHESTFLEDQLELAFPTKHSTAKQAATIAKAADVQKLILGHYSTRYQNIELFRTEASEIFSEIILADDGEEIIVE
ncbi:ribonuclease Z [Christiangramia forsetii]|uniref:Ribonuclease Z n=2 Tax=Christiangramia forsetii TaxID=411153 RepID=A0M2G6_CHRFK|nr:ribonuclease Z [Christiangramia forsetii]GGG39140.1 ribonuclease Z [Christiangramia forsetii]CAL66811.1 ribonuclease Z [Christiangramia forsetii KT0803]